MYTLNESNGAKMKKLSKDKKLSTLIHNSDSDSGENSEHDLSYYMEDRVKLMKEVLKIIKPRKIIAMAPECMRNMDRDEINSLLLEELLGISNKRLKYIFEGKNLDEESSSSDEEQPIDVISLDDISDDDFVIISDEEEKQNKRQKRKKVREDIKVKKEKSDNEKVNINKEKERRKQKDKNSSSQKETMDEDNLMSVLELLELQARARAIRSQLELENRKKKEEQEKQQLLEKSRLDEEDDEIIIEVPKKEEIVITSSESDIEDQAESINLVENESEQRHIEEVNSLEKITTLENQKVTDENREKSETSKSHTIIIDENKEEGTVDQCKSSCDFEKSKEPLGEMSLSISEQCKDQPNNEVNNKNNSPEIKENTEESVLNVSTRNTKCLDNSLDAVRQEIPENSEKDQIAKEKKFRHIRNIYQSYKKDLTADEDVKTSEDVILKPKEGDKKETVEENDDLVINIDQDDLDCIVCD